MLQQLCSQAKPTRVTAYYFGDTPLAVAYFVVAGPLSAVVGDHWAPHTSVWSRPVSIVLAVLSVAWHNHRVDGTPTRLHRR